MNIPACVHVYCIKIAVHIIIFFKFKYNNLADNIIIAKI
jgi:hypothetical protein